ncbi:MAG: prolipoprotein diacylglyceryl transferase [Streptosporangiales bacterium]|nr:prolipoprotein diacylglyceryl transferase [Streptosporangiales bacterium]
MTTTAVLASFPSPATGVWQLGPIPLRAYALCIILGLIVAVWWGERRWVARGGESGTIIDIATWAVPFGLVGGRLYHVMTDWQLYFGADARKTPIHALYVWEGGLGIWGAVALGAVGAWIACRRRGLSLTAVADAVAPGVAVAQAIGRWGNYFNQELFGSPTNLPWAVEIDLNHRPEQYLDVATYHPTFLYESLWCLVAAGVLVWAERRFDLRNGRLFALYVAIYTVGRGWIESLRIDDAHEFFGIRLNVFTSVLVLAGALIYLLRVRGSDQPAAAYTGTATDGDDDSAEDGAEPAEAKDDSGERADADADSSADADADASAPSSSEDTKDESTGDAEETEGTQDAEGTKDAEDTKDAGPRAEAGRARKG